MLRALNNLFAARLDQKVLPHSVLFSDTSSEEFPDAQACDICKQITLEGLFRGCHHRPISQLMKAGSNECRLCCILQLAYLRAFDPKLDIRNEAVVLEALESHLKNEETLVIRYKRAPGSVLEISSVLVSNQLVLSTFGHGDLARIGLFTDEGKYQDLLQNRAFFDRK